MVPSTPPQWIWCPVIGEWNLIPGQVRRLFSPVMQVYMSSLQCCLVFVMPRVRSSTYPDFMQPFLLSTDASNDALGMVLGQKQNGHKVVIVYGGSKFNPAERNYSVTEREALAVVTGIKQFQHYLHRCEFTVLPDHNAACWLMNIREPTGRLGRWTLVLQQYDFEIVHRAGKNNGNPDGLSRHPYQAKLAALDCTGVQTDKIRELVMPTPLRHEILIGGHDHQNH